MVTVVAVADPSAPLEDPGRRARFSPQGIQYDYVDIAVACKISCADIEGCRDGRACRITDRGPDSTAAVTECAIAIAECYEYRVAAARNDEVCFAVVIEIGQRDAGRRIRAAGSEVGLRRSRPECAVSVSEQNFHKLAGCICNSQICDTVIVEITGNRIGRSAAGIDGLGGAEVPGAVAQHNSHAAGRAQRKVRNTVAIEISHCDFAGYGSDRGAGCVVAADRLESAAAFA